MSTNVDFLRTRAWNVPSAFRVIPSTSLCNCGVMFGWWTEEVIFGPEMQLAQSSVGKTLLSRIIRPPTLASFSTRRTR